MTHIVILGANGQIARIVIQRLLDETTDTHLTLFLRNSQRISDLAGSNRVTVVDGSIDDADAVRDAARGQDIIYMSNVDHDAHNQQTKNVIDAAKANGITRVISTNVLGIYGEVKGEYGRWNEEMLTTAGLRRALATDELLEASGLDYTTLRLPWLNDRDEVKYELTYKGDDYLGVSGSRQSMADVIVRIIKDPTFLSKESVGIADPDTQGEDRPVY